MTMDIKTVCIIISTAMTFCTFIGGAIAFCVIKFNCLNSLQISQDEYKKESKEEFKSIVGKLDTVINVITKNKEDIAVINERYKLRK